MIIELGEWLPDLHAINNPGLLEIRGLKPVAQGYATTPEFNSVGTALLTTREIVGGFSSTSGGTVEDFCGDDQDLFRLTLSGTSIAGANASKSAAAYSVPSGGFWDFCQYGDIVLAVNGGVSAADTMQSITIGTSNFADVSAGQPKAQTIATSKDFVIVGNTYDATDGVRENRVRWSAIGDATSANAWDISAATQADFQDLDTSAGAVQRVCGGDEVFVVTSRTVYLMEYVGGAVVWNFRELAPGIGTELPTSVVRNGAYVYFISPDGPVSVDVNGAVRWLARGKCENLIKDVLFAPAGERIVGYHDRQTGSISWSPQDSAVVYAYFYDFDQWVTLNTATAQPDEHIWDSRLAVTSTGVILDSPLFKASAIAESGQLHKIHARNDPDGSAVWSATTGMRQLFQGRRGLFKELRLNTTVYDTAAPTYTINMAVINDPTTEVQTGWTYNPLTKNADHHQGLAEGRFFSFEINGAAASGRSMMHEIEVTDANPSGRY